MNTNCKSCKLAIFCYTDPGEWIFRTKEDVKKILSDIKACPIHKELLTEKLVSPLPSVEAICK